MEDEHSLEAQQKRHDYNQYLEKLKRVYRKQLKEETYVFNPLWQTDKSLIDFSVLGNDAKSDSLSLDSYEIYWVSLDNLFDHMGEVYKNSYQKKKLWSGHIDDKIARALKFWEDGKKMIPPILIMNKPYNTELSPVDGKHRIAICHFFDEKEIPIIISNKELPYFSDTFTKSLKPIGI